MYVHGKEFIDKVRLSGESGKKAIRKTGAEPSKHGRVGEYTCHAMGLCMSGALGLLLVVRKISRVWLHVPVVPDTLEAEAGESFECGV